MHSIADVYDLTKDELLTLERVGEKTADAVLEQIERSKKQPLQRVLLGLGNSACGRANCAGAG